MKTSATALAALLAATVLAATPALAASSYDPFGTDNADEYYSDQGQYGYQGTYAPGYGQGLR